MLYQKLFVSYARTDFPFVLKLAIDLKNASVNVWIDQLEIKPGNKWDSEIERALDDCDCLLFVASHHSVVSENVLNEVNYALEHGKTVIPIVISEGCKMPFRLKRLHWIDFSTNPEKGFESLVKALEVSNVSVPTERRGKQIPNESPTLELPEIEEISFEKAKEKAQLEELKKAEKEFENSDNVTYLTIQTFLRYAEKMNGQQCYYLGWAYQSAKGVSGNYAEAAKWYRQAAEKGNARAMFKIGIMYENGWAFGGDPNYPEAIVWYTKGAKAGDLDAMCHLGNLYAKGLGTDKNLQEAYRWLRLAKERGSSTAEEYLQALLKK